MVGWAGRSSRNRRQREAYHRWFNALTPEQQAQHEIDAARSERFAVALGVIGFVLYFVMVFWIAHIQKPSPIPDGMKRVCGGAPVVHCHLVPDR